MFSKLSKHSFLTDYWQQQPYLFVDALPQAVDLIDGDELAGLACEDSVESRIVAGYDPQGEWVCHQGPFPDFDYDALGLRNWTLLVQGVDQWDDALRALLEHFSFLPRWRLEDIMASFAPQGGGVGPHFDYYDVFLIQCRGRRKWRLGQQCDDRTSIQVHDTIKLLAHFEQSACVDMAPGDMLYVPGGLAHWGTSLSDDCVTLSVGFRAPSNDELFSEAIHILSDQLVAEHRFRDTRQSLDDDPFKLNDYALDYAVRAWRDLPPEHWHAALHEALGRLVTDSRYVGSSETQTSCDVSHIQRRLAQTGSLVLRPAPHARLAYSRTQLFANGVAFNASESFSRQLCHGKLFAPLSAEECRILVVLLNEQLIELTGQAS